jgi:hypothetical protein
MKKLSLMALMLMMLPTLSLAQDHAYKGQIMDSACAKMGNHEAGYKMTGTNTPKDCTMACLKGGSTLMLYSPSQRAAYNLDDQSKAREYAGQDVTVEGTLNESTKTIHVDKIKGAS